MFSKVKEFVKSSKVKELEEERDSYMELHRVQTWKWEQAEQQLVAARATIALQRQRADDQRSKIRQLEQAVLQSERDFREAVDDKTEEREVFTAAYQEILNTLQNSADMTDLPVME